LITLCDGCHASFHPKLAGGLARRWLEKAAVSLARLLDLRGHVRNSAFDFGPALRLFGIPKFREGQLPIILAALSGKSILVVSPTGSGKTLCFQLPAVLSPGLALVVSPLKALMTEQTSTLLRRKIPSTFLNSDLSADEKRIRLSLISRRLITFLYVAPERFFVKNEYERHVLKQSGPIFLVVDEAHCVDQWRRDFRREYARLDEVRTKLGSPPVLAFTATAGKEMQNRILESLGIPDARVFVRDVDRPNIALLRWKCPESRRANQIKELLDLPEVRSQRCMIFVPSTKVGDKLKADLGSLGADIPFYHSRLGTSWDREQLQKRFSGESKPPLNQIICTNAFGMGLDLPNVRMVIHWQQAASIEDQLQELGRAGRDGKPSISVIFHDSESRDVGRLRYMAEMTVRSSAPEDQAEQALRHRYSQIKQLEELLKAGSCVRSQFRKYFGQASAPRRTLSETILNWTFGSQERRSRQLGCCDHCDAKIIQKLGVVAYVRRQLRGS
jgi:ATP-dependent DNA helicase RecQ